MISPRHVRVRSGQFEFVKLNAEKFDWRDTYHLILTLSWPGFASVVFSIYLLINLGFAGLYTLDSHSVAEMSSFFDAFFFSVETLATVGYGHMYPETFYGHLIAMIEIITVIVAPVQNHSDYNYDQIEWNRRFVEIYDQSKENQWTVDYGRIDETEDIAPIQN